MKILSTKQRWVAAAALMLLVLFVLRPGASRLKSRIISSISAGVNRPVDVGSVHIRLLPRPGFELENLVVYDDPSFGAEPMLRASEVTADLRLTSLLRGRIEVARLDLTEPSLNLVHREGGGWNLEALIERATHAPAPPNAAAKKQAPPRFPYIQGTSARINFKNGQEKKPYALINADFSLWQDSDNVWGGRLKAQPFRSDLNLTDVGLLQVDGRWQRARTLKEIPLQINLEWTRAQLGQFTKFLTGGDKGWRGDIQFDAVLTGSPAQLKVTSTASIDDFRRYDIPGGKAIRLAAHCDGEYSAQTHDFREVFCTAPVGKGTLSLSGVMGLPGSHHYTVNIEAENVPATAAAMLAERAKKSLPDDLTTEGTLRGSLSIQEDASTRSKFRFAGEGEIVDFRLSSASNKAEIGPTTVPFVMVDDSAESRRRIQSMAKGRVALAFPKGPHVEFGPLALNTGHSATARGWLNRSGYSLGVSGEGEIGRMLRLARTFGISALAATAEGPAQANLQIAGSWVGEGGGTAAGFPPPQVTGTAKLRNVHVTLAGASDPVEIASAEMQLSSSGVQVTKLNAKAAGATWTGTLEMPRGCGTPESCAVRFALNADEVGLARLNGWVSGHPKTQRWYQVLPSGKAGKSLLARLHASGHVSTNRFLIHGVSATDLSANVTIDAGKVQISGLEADLLGGRHRGKWQADFSVAPSVCSGNGTLTGVSLSSVAGEMEDDWVAGTAGASYELKGFCTEAFWQSAEGTLRVDVNDGALPRVLIGNDAEPLKITRLNGQAKLRSGEIEFTSAKLDSPNGTYQISGTVSLHREVDVKMTPAPTDTARTGYEITGTLAEPHVLPLSSPEQARLKPLPAK